MQACVIDLALKPTRGTQIMLATMPRIALTPAYEPVWQMVCINASLRAPYDTSELEAN